MKENTNMIKKCSRCVMDTTAQSIIFTGTGCKYCDRLEKKIKDGGFLTEVRAPKDIHLLKDAISKNHSNNKYDCIVGVSGGVDSTYALVMAVKSGLNPLAVHMDNGWNTELAQSNIENITNKLGVDLHTHVIKWSEYRFLMQAFFNSDVLDVELLYDNAMRAVNYDLAKKNNIKYILSGVNTSTEGIGIPEGWNWVKTDVRNIRNIANQLDPAYKFETFPNINTLQTQIYRLKGYKWLPFLDYFDYEKETIVKWLVKEYNFKPYPYKHYENVFTRFYQGYILPKKFNVDKRKAHLSTLVITGQLTRDKAELLLANSPYENEFELKKDKKYFLKKMRWTEKDLEEYIARAPRSHRDFPSEEKLARLLHVVRKIKNAFIR
jgi:N-acetyl sugar amidotransferase